MTEYDIPELTRAAIADAIEWIPVRVVAHLDDKLRLPTVEAKAAAIQQVRDILATVQITVASTVTVWSGYDDDERGFPVFATREAAQEYAEHRYREDWVGWGNEPDEIGELTWSERKAYTDAHDGRAGLFDLHAVNGRTDYVVHELTVHKSASDAIREDREREQEA